MEIFTLLVIGATHPTSAYISRSGEAIRASTLILATTVRYNNPVYVKSLPIMEPRLSPFVR